MILRTVVAIDEPALAQFLAERLPGHDLVVERVRGVEGAWGRLLRKGGDIVVVSESLVPSPFEHSIAALNELPEIPTTVVVTDSESAGEHAQLLAAGCDTVLYSGLPQDDLLAAIEGTIENRRQILLRAPVRTEAERRPSLADFVSRSPAMQMFMQVVRRVVPSSSSLLILGETGVGKEHLARAIHNEGPRSAGPFVAINCVALPEQLLESELFGHEEGAFTGATRSRQGAFEQAHGGTLFLDEIGEMPLHLQAKLLRVLQDLQVRKVGGERTVQVDVRVMAASNRDLDAEITAHRFRRDLYFRLSVVELVVPPLSERREDIPAMVDATVVRLAPRIGLEACEVSPEAMEALCRYDWPGNVRELSNVLERALLLYEGDSITPEDLPAGIADTAPSRAPANDLGVAVDWRGGTLHEARAEAIKAVERAYLTAILNETRGRVGLAARRAGIHPRGLYDKMRKLGLNKEDFRRR